MASKNVPKPPPIPSSPITMAIIGLGQRGSLYAKYIELNPKWAKLVAVCDIDRVRCQEFQEMYDIIPKNVIVGDWTLLAKRPKLADAVVICTMDRDHVGPALAFADLKYNIMLEKPMAVTMEDCAQIYNAVIRNNVIFALAHNFRYSTYHQILLNILESNAIGDIMSIQHLEQIGFWHFAHSYVRGNWHNEAKSTFSLLTKSCHDLDLLADMMKTKCKRISSFGSLTHFKKDRKPKEAKNAKNCLDCPYEEKCSYSAKKIYIESFVSKHNKNPSPTWPVNVVQPHGDVDMESISKALRKGNYGRCVYEMDNDVCDQQVVNMEFENGATVSFSMMAFTEVVFTRKTRIFGSQGQLEGDGSNEIKVFDFLTRKWRIVRPTEEPNTSALTYGTGKGQCSYELMHSFVFACITNNQNYILTGPKESLESHLYVFAAEHARRTGTVVDVDEYRNKFLLEEQELPEKQPLLCSMLCGV